MKKIVLYPLSALLGVAFIGCFSTQNSTPNKMSEGTRIPTNNPESACPPIKYKKIGQTAQALTEAALNSNTGGCQIETPSGLYGKDLADFEHLSEGADVYPYEWFMSLKSLVFPEDTEEI